MNWKYMLAVAFGVMLIAAAVVSTYVTPGAILKRVAWNEVTTRANDFENTPIVDEFKEYDFYSVRGEGKEVAPVEIEETVTATEPKMKWIRGKGVVKSAPKKSTPKKAVAKQSKAPKYSYQSYSRFDPYEYSKNHNGMIVSEGINAEFDRTTERNY